MAPKPVHIYLVGPQHRFTEVCRSLGLAPDTSYLHHVTKRSQLDGVNPSQVTFLNGWQTLHNWRDLYNKVIGMRRTD